MSMLTARLALLGLLAAVGLPFLVAAKPPDLPVATKVECEARPRPCATVQDQVPLNAACFEEFLGLLYPGIEDKAESCWRTMLRWVPVSCAPECCTTPTTRLAVIEILPVEPKPVPYSQLVIMSDELREIVQEWERIWFTHQPSHLTPQRIHGVVGSGDETPVTPAYIFSTFELMRCPELLPMPAVCEFSAPAFMCLPPEDPEFMPPAEDRCPDCCTQSRKPPRVVALCEGVELADCVLDNLAKLEKARQLMEQAERCCREGRACEAFQCCAEAAKLCPGSRYSARLADCLRMMFKPCEPACGAVIQASAVAGSDRTVAESASDRKEKQSGWPRIEIKLTIEVKKP